MGQVGDLRAPGKLLQNAAQKQQTSDVDRGRQVLGAQIDKPAEDVWIPAQLIERPNGRVLLTKIDQKAAGYCMVLAARCGAESCGQGVNRPLELVY